MSKTFFISDLHFHHKNILKYEPIRLAATAEFYANESGLDYDTAYQIFKEKYESNDPEAIDEVLTWHDEMLVKYWNQTVRPEDTVWFMGDLCLCTKEIAHKLIKRLNGHKRMVYGNHDHWSVSTYAGLGFEEVSKRPVLVKGYFLLSHAPVYMNDATPFFNIYGHVHGSEIYKTATEHSRCVCVERQNFRPIEIEEFNQTEDQTLFDPHRHLKPQVEVGSEDELESLIQHNEWTRQENIMLIILLTLAGAAILALLPTIIELCHRDYKREITYQYIYADGSYSYEQVQAVPCTLTGKWNRVDLDRQLMKGRSIKIVGISGVIKSRLYYEDSLGYIFSWAIGFILSIVTVVLGIFAGVVHSAPYVELATAEYQYRITELNSDYVTFTSPEAKELYGINYYTVVTNYNQAVTEFLTQIKYDQLYAANIWTSWLHNPACLSIDTSSLQYITK